MKNANQYSSLRTLIFSILFSIYSFLSILSIWSEFEFITPTIYSFYKIFQYILIIILPVLYLSSRPTFKSSIIYLIIFSLGIYSLIRLHDYRFLMCILFVFAASNIDYIVAIKTNFITDIIAFIIILLAYIVGFLPNITYLRVGETIIRQSLGFSHPNFLGITVMIILLQYIILRGKNFYIFDSIGCIILIILVTHFCDSRSAEYTTLLMVLSTLIFNVFKVEGRKINKWIISIIKIFPFMVALLSFLIVAYAVPGTFFYIEANKLLSGRLDIFQYYYNFAGLHLLPKKINVLFMNSSFVGMDNAYIYLLVSFGLIALIIYCYIISRLLCLCLLHQEYYLLLVTLSLCLFGLVESTVIYPFVGICVIAANCQKESIIVERKRSM